MAITDNRTLLIANDVADPGLFDSTGGAVGASDTANYIEGDGSWGMKVSATVQEMMYDATAGQDWTGYTFYIWASCAYPIADFATGGIRMRWAGPTPSDWFEKNMRGVDTGYSGGFTMLVCDVELARADAVAGTDGAVNGTTPVVADLQYVGVVFDVPGMVSGNFNNVNVDAMWALPPVTPGIIVAGAHVSPDRGWNMADIALAGDIGDATKAWGTVRLENGVFTINTPIQFGENDAVALHDFEDTNIVVAWEDNLVDAKLYSWDIIGGSAAQNFQLGIKTGTGATATGSQGMTMLAAVDTGDVWSYGVRYSINANDGNVDTAEFYGCQFLHGGSFLFSASTVDVISSLFNDVTFVNFTNGGLWQKNLVVNANNSSGVAFMLINNTANVKDSVFEFSAGHALEHDGGSPDTYDLVDVQFIGYGADGTGTAAMLVDETTGTYTYNVDFAMTTDDNGATVIVVLSPAVITITCKDINTGALLQNVRVKLLVTSGVNFPFEDSVTITSVTTTATVTHTAHGLATNDYINIEGANERPYNGCFQITVTGVNTYTYVMTSTPSGTPATGTIEATFAYFNSLTNVSGVVTDSRTITVDQPVSGRARRASAGFGTLYRSSPITETVDSINGLTLNIQMIKDEG